MKFIAAFLLAAATLTAQAPPSQIVTRTSIKTTGDTLLKQAKASPDGLAFKVLLTRPDGEEQLAVRTKSGQGEWHHDMADILIALEGEAEIVTGGDVVNAKETKPGEKRGDSVRGGTKQPFRAGDAIRIEPQTAHQLLLEPGTTLRYFVIKIKAK